MNLGGFTLPLPVLLGNLKDDIEFDRHPQGKAGNSDHESSRCLLDAKDITKQIRHGVRDSWLVEEVSGGCDEHAKPDDACDLVK